MILPMAIAWVLIDKDRYNQFNTYARNKTTALYSYQIIADKYMQVYNSF